MIYGSVCSGIEAATVAWHPLGWKPAFFSDIEAFPRAVLSARYPHVPLHGDFTTIKANDYEAIDLLVGGTPCQDFSVAGLRAGIAGDRGNLTLEFVRLAERLRPKWIVWENVPGVLSSDGGRALGAFLGALEELGYGWAYRTLDAKFFGVPQQRRRVFVVGCLGDWRPPAAVLFEPESLRGDSTSRRERVRGTASAPAGRLADGGDVFPCVLKNVESKHWLGNQEAFKGSYFVVEGDQLRFITAVEGERLFGFPDGYTAVDGASDWTRLGALGNSMAVPVMRWIGQRIQMVDVFS